MQLHVFEVDKWIIAIQKETRSL